MNFVEADLGVFTADAENVSLRFEAGELVLTYIDWQERPRCTSFRGVLAFRWQEFDEESIRDDASYEVVGSPWLERQCRLQSVPARDCAHYKLCFNACGTLDVLCRRAAPSP
jgi:hypothetical protein